MANTVHIGNVTFTYPLFWTNKGTVVTAGSRTRTRDGGMVIVWGVSTSQAYKETTLLCRWEAKAQIDAIRAMAGTGALYEADFEGTGALCYVRIPHDAIKDDDVKHFEWGDETVHAHVTGHDTDKYNGKITVIIEAA